MEICGYGANQREQGISGEDTSGNKKKPGQ